jgi:predicted nuclease with TOPRIM domain
VKKAQTIRDVKKDLKWAREVIQDEQKRVDAWRDYAFDLHAKLEQALERLRIISIETYYANECNSFDSTEARAQKTASHGLKKIAGMKERKP